MLNPCSSNPDVWIDGEAEDGTLEPGLGEVAVAGCRKCALSGACRTQARENAEPYGIWGGETTADRAKALGTTVAELRQEAAVESTKRDAQALADEMIRERLTQAQMAERYGVSVKTITRWMAGADLTEPCEICERRIKFNPLTIRPGAGRRSALLCPACRREFLGMTEGRTHERREAAA
jgi:hypothetical protein